MIFFNLLAFTIEQDEYRVETLFFPNGSVQKNNHSVK